MFIDGYLALCSAVGTGTATEITLAGYSRQPIAFGDPVSGVAANSNAYSFGQALRHEAVGRAIYDAPTGGNLLLVCPFPTPLASGRLPWDDGEAGYLFLSFAAMLSIARGAAFNGTVAADAVAGTCWDTFDTTPNVLVTGDPNPITRINPAVLTAGVALTINRGILQATAR